MKQDQNQAFDQYCLISYSLSQFIYPSISNKSLIMNKDELPPVLLTHKRYTSSVPSGKISQFSPTEVPIISKKGANSRNGPTSMHEITDPNLIDQRLKSLSRADSQLRVSIESDKKEKANLKFLRYRFNPGSRQDQGQNIEKGHVEQYGQLGKGNRQKISINVFYDYKNVLFQDERAPLVYRRLFLEKEQRY